MQLRDMMLITFFIFVIAIQNMINTWIILSAIENIEKKLKSKEPSRF